MSFTTTTSGAIIQKAGAGASSTATSSGGLIKELADQAEGIVNSITRYDWVANWGSLNANFKPIVTACVSAKAAIGLINYDYDNLSLAKGQTTVSVLYDEFQELLNVLRREAEVRRAIGAE